MSNQDNNKMRLEKNKEIMNKMENTLEEMNKIRCEFEQRTILQINKNENSSQYKNFNKSPARNIHNTNR